MKLLVLFLALACVQCTVPVAAIEVTDGKVVLTDEDKTSLEACSQTGQKCTVWSPTELGLLLGAYRKKLQQVGLMCDRNAI